MLIYTSLVYTWATLISVLIVYGAASRGRSSGLTAGFELIISNGGRHRKSQIDRHSYQSKALVNSLSGTDDLEIVLILMVGQFSSSAQVILRERGIMLWGDNYLNENGRVPLPQIQGNVGFNSGFEVLILFAELKGNRDVVRKGLPCQDTIGLDF
ncbi:hypothetical protein FQA39_LY12198 [Lamprigera yunnana]|nr:hypothetical protein FQA39_LY12198 [Lamprigera yunnana]